MRALGLPEGSVRAMLALIPLSAAAYLWVRGMPVTTEHLAIVTGAAGFYFGGRTATPITVTPPIDLDAVDLLRKP